MQVNVKKKGHWIIHWHSAIRMSKRDIYVPRMPTHTAVWYCRPVLTYENRWWQLYLWLSGHNWSNFLWKMQIIQLDLNNWFLCNMNLKTINNSFPDYILLNSVTPSGTAAKNIKKFEFYQFEYNLLQYISVILCTSIRQFVFFSVWIYLC
jgi:hypothetical protein